MRPQSIQSGGIPRALEHISPGVNDASEAGGDFQATLESYLSEVDSLQDKADEALQEVAAGNTDNLHQLVIAVNEAELSFRLMTEARNKLIGAYKEIMRMRV